MKRKNAPSVSRDQIVQAALALIDRDGLDRFNLAGVAALVGITTASLYYHVADRADLLAAVARYLLDGPARGMVARRGAWQDVLVATSLEARRSILQHPKAAPLLLQYPPRHLAAEGYARGLALVEAAGVPTPDALQICHGLESITWGSTLLAAATLSGGPANPAASGRRAEEQQFIATCHAFLAGFAATRESASDG